MVLGMRGADSIKFTFSMVVSGKIQETQVLNMAVYVGTQFSGE